MKDYKNLKNKTVFEFCKDESIIEEVLPYIPNGYDREQFLSYYWSEYPYQHALSFIELAELIGDNELKKEAEKQFADDLDKYFNEQ